MVTQTKAVVVRTGQIPHFFLKVKYTIFADKLHVVMKGVMPRSLA